ncbi:IPT/TIG domain-containing protein [Hymenobacter negativus]|uniref:IPT/TIG domain-containing protein n=1 Tax=Hymenobacter negativus TaxID=2795026 RepID=A0ABS3QP86_9BACT|nr:IPT/TIG domain-containing protein [Hymenobacter negativus]MBO2012922.1 IPT/TIG domain-containing protein [Hymenobacter negativus]
MKTKLVPSTLPLLALLFFACEREDAPHRVLITDITPGTTQIGGSTLNTAVIGDTLTIQGEGFSGVTTENQVTVQGLPAPVLTASTTQLRARVPAGVPYAYVSVVVTRDGYEPARHQISVRSTPSPIITGIRPSQGRVGTVVTIYGRHLLETVQADQLAFANASGQAASVIVSPLNPVLSTADSLQIQVPAGAGTGRIALYAHPVENMANSFGSIVTSVFTVIP